MYDICATQEEIRMSMAPINHMLDVNRYENKQNCVPQYGIVGGNPTTSVPKWNLVDIENDLHGLVRPATKCSEYYYRPSQNGTSQGVEYIKPVKHPRIDPGKVATVPKCGVFLDRPKYDFL